MTDPKLLKDMEASIKWLEWYFEEKKSDILFEVDEKNQAVKATALEEAKKISENK